MRVLVMDNTEDSKYYRAMLKHLNETDLDVETVAERATSKLTANMYDMVIMSDLPGRIDLYDVADKIKSSALNRKCEIVLMLDHPTKMSKVKGILRGRSFRALKTNQVEELASIFERK